MATRPIINDHNATTDEITSREMNDTEFVQYQKDMAAGEAKAAEAEQASTDKANATAKLEALGLTADDLKALGL